MHRGYIKLWRKIQDNPLWKERRKFSKAEAWIDIIMEAQHSPEPDQVLIGNTMIICNRGECIKSLETWSKRWGWTKSATRRFLSLLKNMGNIDTESVTVTTRIKVINYDTYCPLRNANETQVKRKRNASETQAAPDKNVNNVKNDNNNTNGDFFGHFWRSYPKKVGKQSALKAFKKIKNPSKLLPEILNAIENQKNSDQWKTENGRYIPNPATWLNRGQWEDETTVQTCTRINWNE